MRVLRSGVFQMLLSAVFFAVMAAFVRGLPDVSAYTTVMGRFVIGALVCVGLFALRLDRPRWVNWPWMVVRGAVGGLAVVLLYWSIPVSGLAKAMMLSYTYVVFASLMAIPILGERLRPGHWLAIAVALAGTTLICGGSGRDFRAVDLVPLISAFCSGVAVIAVTRCRETDTSTNIFWSQSPFGIALAAWPMVTRWAPLTSHQLWLILAVGLLAAAGQLCMTYAYKHTGAAQGSLLSLTTPVLTAAIGVLYFHEPFTVGFGLGASLILTACVYLVLRPVQHGPALPTPD